VVFDPDTSAGPASCEAALVAAGCGLAAVDAVVDGSAKSVFAMVRPPGHHAEPQRVMGFCLFNNIAIAAHHALDSLGMNRVAIVDFDVHHGNGTQAAFYTDPRVLYLSTHQHPYYPGTGSALELGADKGVGSTLNIPLRSGHSDAEYNAIYSALVPRILEQFQPELILVSAGLDLMEDDPLAGMGVSTNGVLNIARSLVGCAERLCNGRIVFMLEGGYDLDSLTDGVGACLNAMGQTGLGDEPLADFMESQLGDAKHHLAHYRPFFLL
ncbi:MAG TPA: histone deacetylase, partial [Myxococcales bacterium]|nr:histone deacetylase [Myxococcales bacterium]